MPTLKSNSGILRFLQLFVLIYFFLYVFPFPLSSIPYVGIIFNFYDQFIEFLTIWSGENVFGLEKVEKIKMTGSGDTTFDYLKIFTITTLSLFISIVFLILKTKINFDKFNVFIKTYIRYFLAIMLLSYGFAKFFEGQFSYPSIERLDQKIGDSSPMGLLWTFMGYSKLYSVFGGLAQVSAGVLLIFRRTSVIGSLLALMVMTNIVVLNFSYDVPVKLFSMHLVLISIVLLYPNLKKIIGLFFLNKTITLTTDNSLIKNKGWGYAILAIKLFLLVGGFLFFSIFGFRSVFDKKEIHNLNAVYQPETFLRNENITFSEVNKWKKFIINDNYATIFYNESYEDFKLKVDTINKSIQLESYSDSLKVYDLKYNFLSYDVMNLSGKIDNDTIDATFKAKRKEDFQLIKRKFNWINEYPYNR